MNNHKNLTPEEKKRQRTQAGLTLVKIGIQIAIKLLSSSKR